MGLAYDFLRFVRCPLTYPEANSLYDSGPTHIAGTVTGGTPPVSSVWCSISYYDEASDKTMYWNWSTQTWTADYTEPGTSTPATGGENWEMTTGLPAEWPGGHSFCVGAYAVDWIGKETWAEAWFFVGDKIPPVIRYVTANPNVLWPPNRRMVNVRIAVEASDNADPAPVRAS